jgi:hypothetical protein
MPSDIAKQIVQQIYSNDKAAAIDSMNDALAASTYDAIQQQKVNFAKQMGFELNDTGQEAADEVADQIPDNTEVAQEVEVDERQPHEPPTEEQQEEPVTDETDS